MSEIPVKPDTLSQEKAQLIELLLKKKGIAARRAQFIPRRLKANHVALSFAQQRLWFVNQLEPGNSSYNISADLRLKGQLHLDALARSFSEVVRRHEVLRTTFAEVDGAPVQLINAAFECPLPVTDLSTFAEQEREVEARRLAHEEARRPFDLGRSPLLRVRLLKLSEQDHVLLVTMHHIVSDGWSMGVLVRELTALYAAYSEGKESPLEELPIQYADFAAWQREWLSGEVLEEQLSYWRAQLSGAPTLLELPTDRPRPAVQTFRGARHGFTMTKELTQSLHALSQREGATLFMTLLAAWQVLLSRQSGQFDISVGTDIANRNREETEKLVGFFVNMLVMRTDLSKNPTFRELLGRVREVALGAFAHQDLPFEKIVEELRPARMTSHSPLFQVVFVLQNAPMPAPVFAGLTTEPLAFDTQTVRFDLSLVMTEEDGALRGSLTYRTDIFDAATIARTQAHFVTLLQSIVAEPETRINALELLTEEEKQQHASRKKELKQSNFQKFKSHAQKSTVLSPEQLVSIAPLRAGETLPLLVQARMKDVDLAGWVANNRQLIADRLAAHGAILFRQFNISAVESFEQVVRAVSPELLNYGEPSTPRTHIGNNIYTSTEYPAHQSIPLHNELSYSHNWPLKVWFCCVQPATEGGETPIADSRRIFDMLDPKIKERFIDKKVMYVRNYGDGLGLPWQTVFQTNSSEEVEAYCRRAGVRFEWRGRDRLRTWQVRQSIIRHPQTGEVAWFNQAHVHHLSSLTQEVRESLLAAVDDKEFPLDINAFYGDGSAIEVSVLDEIREAYSEASVPVAWQRGDILLLDNILAAHGRAAFSGPRKIVVAMAEPQQGGVDE